MPITHKIVHRVCSTNDRKLMMWQIAAGGKYGPHRWGPECEAAGCVPLSAQEFALLMADGDRRLADRIMLAGVYENMAL